MATMEKRARGSARAELQAWYLDSLRPKLVDAAAAGIVAPAAGDELDRQVRDLLRLPVRGANGAAA